MNKQEHHRTLSIGLILIRGLVSVYRAMMHNSLTIFGKIVTIRMSLLQADSLHSTTLLVSARAKGLDLVGLNEPEDEILEEPEEHLAMDMRQ